jgi:glycosyltransferase involved in cell wall biosynthesis
MGSIPNWSVFLNSNHRGWILDALAQESAHAVGIVPTFQYLAVSRRELFVFRNARNFLFPKFSSHNLFMHQDIFISISQRRSLAHHFNSVFVTHLTGSSESYSPLKNADLVFVQNQSVADTLREIGIDPERIRVIFGAVNHKKYFPLTEFDFSRNPFVLITSDCKPRKNPSKIMEVIQHNPELNFVIHGKGWNSFLSESYLKFSNLQLIDFDLESNPSLMRNASTFLTLSTNEGGPIPILEALASGTPCVATSTGFAPELLTGDRGFMVPVNFEIESVSEAIRKALKLKRKVWNRDLLEGGFSWKELGSQFFSAGTLP